MIETAYNRIAPVDQNDLEFFMSADNDTYIDLDIKLYVRGKLISVSEKFVAFTDLTVGTNNFLHSLFSQCNVTFNDITILQESEHYHYLSYLETLMICSHTSLERVLVFREGNMQPSEPSAENLTATTNLVFITRFHRLSASREVHLFGRLHSDVCIVPLYLEPGVRLQIRLTKARPNFYLMN